MKIKTSIAAAAAIAALAAAGQASATTYDASGNLNLLGVLVTSNGGVWDDATGDGSWNLHIDGTAAGFGISDISQTWTMDAVSGTGVLNPGTCTGDATTCSVMGAGIVGPWTAATTPVGAGSNGFTFYVTALSQNATFNMNMSPVSPVPIPAAAWLFGSALLGLTGVTRRKNAAA